MPAQSGRRLRIKRGDGASPEAFTAISGAREESYTINNELVDVTDKDDAGFRTYLSEVGLKSISLSCSGVSQDAVLMQDTLNGTVKNYQIDIENVGTIEGAFAIASYEESGAHNGELTFSLSLESSGSFAFQAAP